VTGAEHYLAGEDDLQIAGSLIEDDALWDDLEAHQGTLTEIQLRTALASAHFLAARAAAALAGPHRDPGADLLAARAREGV
jgi:hypothetical protein